MNSAPLEVERAWDAPSAPASWRAAVGRFTSADWSLLAATPGKEFHPYPARFIPALPGQALDLLGVSGSVIDPFCGSGTTLGEGLRRGLDVYGSDINPVACLISRVRTHKWHASDGAALLHHAAALRQASLTSCDAGLSAIPRVAHWFEPWAQSLLAGAIRYLDSLDPDDPWRDRVAAAISAAVVRISRQESDTRYAAIEKFGDAERGAEDLYQSLLRLGGWLKANTADYRGGQVQVDIRDARDLSHLPDHTIGCAIFSPPYPNAYEYWLYHKYRMYWLGYDPISVREAEIGARPHYCKPNGLDENDFEGQFADCLGELSRVLAPGAPMVVVIGDAQIAGRLVDSADLTRRAAAVHGFRLHASILRPINTLRSSFNRAHSRGRRHEHVLLFRSQD